MQIWEMHRSDGMFRLDVGDDTNEGEHKWSGLRKDRISKLRGHGSIRTFETDSRKTDG